MGDSMMSRALLLCAVMIAVTGSTTEPESEISLISTDEGVQSRLHESGFSHEDVQEFVTQFKDKKFRRMLNIMIHGDDMGESSSDSEAAGAPSAAQCAEQLRKAVGKMGVDIRKIK